MSGPSPFHIESASMCALEIGLAGIRTQGLRLAKAALYQLSYKPGFYAQLIIINSWLISLFGLGRHFQLATTKIVAPPAP